MERLLNMLSLGNNATTDEVVGKVAECISAARAAEARAEEAEDALTEANEKMAGLEEELSAARTAAEESRKAGEDAFIDELVSAGRVAPHDDERKEKARKLYAGDPAAARELLLGGYTAPATGETIMAHRTTSGEEPGLYDMQAAEFKKFYPNV